MRKPRLNENTMAKLEIYGCAECGKNYYELKDYIDTEGNRKTMLEWTNTRTGDARAFDWEKCTKGA
jgi:hypothetical protein